VLGQTAAVLPPEPEPPEPLPEPAFRSAGARLFIEGSRGVAGLPMIDGEEQITLHGRGFVPGAALAVQLDGAQLAEARADSAGTFRIIVPTRQLGAGEHRLLVRGGGAERLALFVRGAADEALGRPPQQFSPPPPDPVDEGPPEAQEQGKPTLDPRAIVPGQSVPQGERRTTG
jgi:hypothetical protein